MRVMTRRTTQGSASLRVRGTECPSPHAAAGPDPHPPLRGTPTWDSSGEPRHPSPRREGPTELINATTWANELVCATRSLDQVQRCAGGLAGAPFRTLPWLSLALAACR